MFYSGLHYKKIPAGFPAGIGICLKSSSELLLSVRKNCHVTGPLDRYCKSSLMGRACACDPSGKDLAAFRNILAELASILVIDGAVLAAEDTDLFLPVEAASFSEGSI